MCNTSPHTLSDSSPRFRSRHCLPGNASPVANDVGTCKIADRRICTACIKRCDFIGISNPFDCVIPQVGLCFLFFQLSHWRIKITGVVESTLTFFSPDRTASALANQITKYFDMPYAIPARFASRRDHQRMLRLQYSVQSRYRTYHACRWFPAHFLP